MLWLWKFCDNFGLRKQHLRCDDGWRLMAVDIDWSILGTAQCWNGRSYWLLRCLTWGCTRARDVHYYCGAAVRSRVTVTVRSSEHFAMTVTINSTEHFRVTANNMSLSRQWYQYVYWGFVSCELLNSLSECSPQSACRTSVCCRLWRSFETALNKVHYRC